jgi:hypothetical protein
MPCLLCCSCFFFNPHGQPFVTVLPRDAPRRCLANTLSLHTHAPLNLGCGSHAGRGTHHTLSCAGADPTRMGCCACAPTQVWASCRHHGTAVCALPQPALASTDATPCHALKACAAGCAISTHGATPTPKWQAGSVAGHRGGARVIAPHMLPGRRLSNGCCCYCCCRRQ